MNRAGENTNPIKSLEPDIFFFLGTDVVKMERHQLQALKEKDAPRMVTVVHKS